MLDNEHGYSWLTISQAAEFLNVSKVTIRRWTNDGKLKCSRVGTRQERRFLKSELLKLFSDYPDLANEGVYPLGETEGNHRCLICEDVQQESEAIADEIVAQISAGANVILVSDSARSVRLALALAKRGSDFEVLLRSRTLRQLSVEESYLVSGSFSAIKAAAFVESSILDAMARGFERVLFVGWSEWLYRGSSTRHKALAFEVIEYERKLNELLERYPRATALCPYILSKDNAKTLLDVVLHHPELRIQSQLAAGQYRKASARSS
ncbi:MAG: excisionase family DNA binding protein [Gammaproteobacteria bacterium]|jgi:excisionase family DNA binding protein